METKSSSKWSDYLVPILLVIGFAIFFFWWYKPAADVAGARVKRIALEPFLMPQGEEGVPKTVSDLKGKITFITLWATWCGPCREELPQIDAIFNRFRQDPEVQIWTIVVDSEVNEGLHEKVVELFEQKRISLPVYVFSSPIEPESIVPAYIPVALLIGPDSKVVGQWIGSHENLEAEVATLVNNLRSTTGKATAQNADVTIMR